MPEKKEHKEIIRAYLLVRHRQFFKHVADIILSKEQSTSIQAIEIKIYIMCRRKWILQWQTLLHERNEPNTSKPNPQFSNIQLYPTKPQNWFNPHGYEMSLLKEGKKTNKFENLLDTKTILHCIERSIICLLWHATQFYRARAIKNDLFPSIPTS